MKIPLNQSGLEDEAEKCKSSALTIVESLDHYCYNIPDFENIDKYLKFAEGSIKKARKIIKTEIESRTMNQKRQEQITKKTI